MGCHYERRVLARETCLFGNRPKAAPLLRSWRQPPQCYNSRGPYLPSLEAWIFSSTMACDPPRT